MAHNAFVSFCIFALLLPNILYFFPTSVFFYNNSGMVAGGRELTLSKLGDKTKSRVELRREMAIEESNKDERWKREEER